MDVAEDLKQRLRDMHEYHIDEYVERLYEIGGPGVGGTEPRHHPHSVTRAETERELKMVALQQSVSTLWCEASWCYVYGQFRACIALMATVLEAALKLELEQRGTEYDQERTTLGKCIEKARAFLPAEIVELAQRINNTRNDVVHANIERTRPESVFHPLGAEHEVQSLEDISRNIKDGGIAGDGELLVWSSEKGWERVYLYKRAARETIENAERILSFLCPD